MYTFPNLEPVSCSMSVSKRCFLTRIQVSQETSKVVSWRTLHSLLWSTQRLELSQWSRFFFLELPCFFYDPAYVGNLISGSSAFSKSSLYIWKFSGHVLLKPSLKDFEDYLASMWNEYNCVVVWTFFGISLLCDCNENWPVPVLWLLLSFPNLLTYWVQHFHTHHLSGFEIALLEFHHLH